MLKPAPQKGSYRCCDSLGTEGGIAFSGRGSKQRRTRPGHEKKHLESHEASSVTTELLQTRVLLPAAQKRALTGLSRNNAGPRRALGLLHPASDGSRYRPPAPELTALPATAALPCRNRRSEERPRRPAAAAEESHKNAGDPRAAFPQASCSARIHKTQ